MVIVIYKSSFRNLVINLAFDVVPSFDKTWHVETVESDVRFATIIYNISFFHCFLYSMLETTINGEI